MALIIYEPTGM